MKNSVLCYLEETAARLPDKVAFFDAEGEITFEQLRKSAVDIAFAIQEGRGKKKPYFNVYTEVGKKYYCFHGDFVQWEFLHTDRSAFS